MCNMAFVYSFGQQPGQRLPRLRTLHKGAAHQGRVKASMSHGPQVAGVNIFKLLQSIRETGAVAVRIWKPLSRQRREGAVERIGAFFGG